LTIDTQGEDAAFIDFAHDTRDTRSPERISYRISLTSSQPNYGGRRYWFCCPGTGKRAAKLFLPRGGHQFLSREAYRLGYACQRETRTDRLMRNARRLHRELGGKGDALEEDAPEKPKGMHWRTYERKLAALTEAVGAADEAFAKWIGRQFGDERKDESITTAGAAPAGSSDGRPCRGALILA
jgi:hypothetical protein